MTALARLCRSENVKLRLRSGEARKAGWPGSQNWRCTLLYAGRQFTFDYFGSWGVPDPVVEIVIGNLLKNAEYGELSYERYLATFARRANDAIHNEWLDCERIASGMDRLLGDSFTLFKETWRRCY